MTTADLTRCILIDLSGTSTPGLRVTPTQVARWYGVPLKQAQLACRRVARKGALKGGRTV